MRKVRLIAPFLAIQGNLSGAQDLRYAENDNKAFESPAGKKNFARNYDPRYIGSLNTKTGKYTYRVKTKSAVHMTPKATKAMALLGGAGAVYGALIKVKTTATYLGVLAQYNALVAIGEKRTFQKYCMDIIMQAIAAYAQNVTFAGPATVVNFKNPWYDASMSADVTISQSVVVKFWSELHGNGITFEVGGAGAIAEGGFGFEDLIGGSLNILSLTSQEVGSTTYVKKGNDWLTYADGVHIEVSEEIIPNEKYSLTSVAPTA